MAVTRLNIYEFLALAKEYPVLDVRSPGEFAHAHIPAAHSLPLFTDEERKIVGTAYKQESKEKAIKIGLAYFGQKMVKMVEEAEGICKNYIISAELNGKKRPGTVDSVSADHRPTVLVHCWRGGMRSAGVAWLLDLYGFKVYSLAGGYKAYRKWALAQFEKVYPFQIIGGYTGSGKTELLQALAAKGETIIDLEALAHHKGSAFGNLGQPAQPTQEMFENRLAETLRLTDMKSANNGQSDPVIWIEDESQRIGEVNIPIHFFRYMRTRPVFFLNIPFEKRLDYIVEGYGKFEKEDLVNAIMRIKKRLGGLETKTAIGCLVEDDVKSCFSVLLKYYDRYYNKSAQHNREQAAELIRKLDSPVVSAAANAALMLSMVKKPQKA